MARTIRPAWPLWLAVLVLHGLVLMGLDAILGVHRLAVQASPLLEAAIVTEPAPPPVKPLAPVAATTKATMPRPSMPHTLEESALASLPQDAATSAPMPTSTLTPMPSLPEASLNKATALTTPAFKLPVSTDLRYQLIKGNDTAKASLRWMVSQSADGATLYESIVEATYLGFSALKQTSTGIVDSSSGLQPMRYSDKRRGKSEQAVHFERDKNTITFSNNRPPAHLAKDAQDRVSMLLQLTSLFAGDPSRYAAGHTIAMPIANVDELEHWIFEVQATERLMLPMGEREAVKLTRRPRRPFDPLVEIWLSPTEQWLPVRIRHTDSTGVTDQLLTSSDKL